MPPPLFRAVRARQCEYREGAIALHIALPDLWPVIGGNGAYHRRPLDHPLFPPDQPLYHDQRLWSAEVERHAG